MTRRERREMYKKTGRCPNCSRVMDREGYYCSACLPYRRTKSKRERERRVVKQKCQKCARPLVDLSVINCPACTLRRATFPLGLYPGEMEIR